MYRSHSDWCEMVPHSGFDLHFSDNEWCWASFHVFVSHLYVFFGEMTIQEYWSDLPFPLPVNHILSELSTMTRLSWWPCMAWLIASLNYTSPIATRLWSMKGAINRYVFIVIFKPCFPVDFMFFFVPVSFCLFPLYHACVLLLLVFVNLLYVFCSYSFLQVWLLSMSTLFRLIVIKIKTHSINKIYIFLLSFPTYMI